MIFRVTFKYSDNTYCSNIAIAESEQEVINYYGKKYDSVYIEQGNAYDLEEAKRKGKPIVTIK